MVGPLVRAMSFVWHVVITSWQRRLAWYGQAFGGALIAIRMALSAHVPGTKVRIFDVAASLASVLIPVAHTKRKRRARLVWQVPEDDLVFGVDPRDVIEKVAVFLGMEASTLRSIGIVAGWLLPFIIPLLLTQILPGNPKPTRSTQGHGFPNPPTSPPRPRKTLGKPSSFEKSSPTDVFSSLEDSPSTQVTSSRVEVVRNDVARSPPSPRELTYAAAPPTLDQMYGSTRFDLAATRTSLVPPSLPPSPPYSVSPYASSLSSSSASSTPTRRTSHNLEGLTQKRQLLARAAARAKRSTRMTKEVRDAKMIHKRSAEWVVSLRDTNSPKGMPAWH